MTKRIILGISLISMCFMQCVHQEKAADPSIQPVVEMPEFPAIEDPEPPIEEPFHREMFSANLSVDPMKEMKSFLADGRLTPSILEMYQSLENAQLEDPDLKNVLQSINVATVLDVVNPEKQLDPKLEEFLKKMLEREGMDLPLPALPEIIPTTSDGEPDERGSTTGLEQPWEEHDAACAEEVWERYASGFRGCSLDYDSNVQAINSNYQRRTYEAEERLLRRNEEVLALSDEKLNMVGKLLREINKLIRDHPAVDDYEEVRLKLTYFGLVYAYYFRTNVSILQEYGLAVNQSFYEQEIKTIGERRDDKLEEASDILDACIDFVNGLIAEEIEKSCS